MKKQTFLSVFVFIALNTYSQQLRYEAPGKLISFVKNTNIENAMFISEVTSDLWYNLAMPYKERDALEKQRKKQGFFLYREQDNYKSIIDYVSVELTATCNGKNISAKNTNDKLTSEQKKLLNSADLGTDVLIKIKFRHKYPENNEAGNASVIEGELPVTVVPETQAEYPGGLDQLALYLKRNIIEKVAEPNAPDKLGRVLIKFTVNENGEVIHAKIAHSSAHAKTDLLLLDAMHKMEKWKPARNSKGTNIKQQFSISFHSGC